MTDSTPATIRSARAARGLSQAATSAAMREQGHRWHQTTIARLEDGARALLASEVRPLASILGVHPMTLLGADSGDATAYRDGWRDGQANVLRRIAAVTQEVTDD